MDTPRNNRPEGGLPIDGRVAPDNNVTERKFAEQTLRTLTAAVTAAANAIMITNCEGVIVWANPAFTTLTGYGLAEAVGRNPRDLLKSGREERAVYEQLWDTILAGRTWRGELLNRRKDGSCYSEEQTITPVCDARGEITHFIAIKQDLTERKRLNQMVEAGRRKFQAVFEQAAVGMVIADCPSGRFLTVNRCFCEMVGYSAGELVHLSCHDITHPDDVAGDIEQWEQISLRTVSEFSREKRYRRKDGSYFWAREFVAPLDPTEARPAVRIGVITDLSDCKRAEEACCSIEARYCSLFENMAEGLAYCEMQFDGDRPRDFVYLAVNEAFGKLTGLKNVVGRKVTDIIPGIRDSDPKLFEIYGRVARGGAPERFEVLVAALKMWFAISVYGAGRDRFVAVFDVITERKQAELSLRLFRALVDQSSDTVEVIDPETGRFLDVNARGLMELGYSRDEYLALRVFDIDPTIAESAWPQIATRVRAGPLRGEGCHRRKDGTTFPVEFNVKLVRLDRDYQVAIVRDITERKRAQDWLRQAEAKFQSIFDHAIEGIFQTTPEGEFLAANPAMARILGYASAAELIAERTDIGRQGYVDPLRREEFKRVISRDGIVVEFESQVICRDGSRKWVSMNARAIRDAHGDVQYFEGSVVDISERKRAEEALKHSEERYRLLFENNPLPSWIYDLETFRFLAVNESAVQHYGYTREEFLGMTTKDIRPPEDIPALVAFVEASRTVDRSSSPSRHRRKGGTIIEVEIFSRPVAFDGREARLVLAADVTEKKLIEKRLLRAQRLESIGMLAAGIAHDLNNVLAPIGMAAPLLRIHATEPGDLHLLETLEKCSERGAGLVRQILGFAHGIGGEPRLMQVKNLLRDVAQVVTATFPKSIQLDDHIPHELWPIVANPTQIHQVLFNLVVNARDAMPHGGVLRLRAANRVIDAAGAHAIDGARPGAWLALEVGDTGTGIPPDILPRIWEPFFTTKTADKGTGLGLSTTRGIVANHHGFITIESQVDRGTTLRVYLPAAGSAMGEGTHVGTGTAFSLGRGELILLVDDEQPIRKTAGAILTKASYQVVEAGDGAEAAALFAARPEEFALVITDCDMPIADGAALARSVRAFKPSVKILAMSGLSSRDLDVNPNAFATAFMVKPFTADELLDQVRRLLTDASTPT